MEITLSADPVTKSSSRGTNFKVVICGMDSVTTSLRRYLAATIEDNVKFKSMRRNTFFE
jgi:hypothetical protein